MAAEDRIKQLEQQKNRVAVDAYGQGTESEKYNHGCQNPVNAVLKEKSVWPGR